jgi:hypothetical protein
MPSQDETCTSTTKSDDAGFNSGQALPAWVLTALPPLIIGLLVTTLALAGVSLSELVVGGLTPYRLSYFSPWHIVPAALAALVVAVAALGVLRGLPRWSYTWAYATVVMAAFAVVVLAEDRPALITPWVDALIALALLGALLGVALIAALRGGLDALVAGLGFCSAFVLISYSAVSVAPFRRVDLALLSLPAGLVFSALIAAVVRGIPRAEWVAGVLTVALGAGLMWLYASAVSGAWALKASQFASRVVLYAALGLMGPPLLAWLLDKRKPAVAA